MFADTHGQLEVRNGSFDKVKIGCADIAGFEFDEALIVGWVCDGLLFDHVFAL